MNKDSRLQINFAFSKNEDNAGKEMTVLAADVGGTKTNLALYKMAGENFQLQLEKTYHSAQYSGFTEIISTFLSENQLALSDRFCAGVAGPIMNGKVQITNLDWAIDTEEIKSKTSIKSVSLINDLEATAYGLAGLTQNDIITLHAGDESIKGNIAIIAPGTGLGEAGMYWDGNVYHPFPTEGGHSEFSPRTDLDIDLFRFLQKKYGIVSWEKTVAGPGIHDMYLFLREKRNIAEPNWLSDALNTDDPSAVISHAALEEKDIVCMETLDLFVRYLARESASLVLKMKATGGLYLGGGIPPKIAKLLLKETFYKEYIDCDRMQHLLEPVPIHIISNEKTALIGAAWYGGMS
ncbi:MAG: glucokinase [Bacteroidetes bacterium]|nr:glucokinase [Bacteroidota bacterium]